jgi:hypothetical protein
MASSAIESFHDRDLRFTETAIPLRGDVLARPRFPEGPPHSHPLPTNGCGRVPEREEAWVQFLIAQSLAHLTIEGIPKEGHSARRRVLGWN